MASAQPTKKAGIFLHALKAVNRHLGRLAFLLLGASLLLPNSVAHTEVRAQAKRAKPISRFDRLIREVSKEHQVDWRLVASIIAVESSFKPFAVSHKGAQGLMQIMPVVAQEFGVRNITHPRTNVSVGIRHLQRWYRIMDGATPEDRLRLALAAYNGGPSHVRDAQTLALRLKKNPRRWRDVKSVLPLLEHELYHGTVPRGYCQGRGMVAYVDNIMKRYNRYQALHPHDVASGEPPLWPRV